MSAQLRSELLKLRSTRTPIALTLGMLAIVLLSVFAQGFSEDLVAMVGPSDQRSLLSASTASGLFACFAGLLAVTTEFRYGTIRPTLLFEPRRRIVLAAKAVASALVGVVMAVLSLGAAFGAAAIVFEVRDIGFALDRGQVALLVGGSIAGAAAWAAIGVGVGALVRSQVGAIIGVVAWSAIVEGIMMGFVPSVGRFLPGSASNALADQPGDHLLPAGAAAAVLVAWTVAVAVAGAVRGDRSDVA